MKNKKKELNIVFELSQSDPEEMEKRLAITFEFLFTKLTEYENEYHRNNLS
jgi:hypothetical protein